MVLAVAQLKCTLQSGDTGRIFGAGMPTALLATSDTKRVDERWLPCVEGANAGWTIKLMGSQTEEVGVELLYKICIDFSYCLSCIDMQERTMLAR
ncbi:hypothetical protein FIU83_05225 [Halomonas sp. THAF5a]|nr:hypothetical protein FIU83_05225 [Halomonas sp. THAF5a]